MAAYSSDGLGMRVFEHGYHSDPPNESMMTEWPNQTDELTLLRCAPQGSSL